MRIRELDGLRGIAIIMVLCHHFTLLHPLMRHGWIGVDLFFVLSGFLVSGLLYKEYKVSGGINVGRFFIRRGFKIYPSYYFLLIVATIVLFLQQRTNVDVWKMTLDMRKILSEMFFVQNYVDTLWPHSWSLSVEEHFYFLILGVVFVMVYLKTLSSLRLNVIVFLTIGFTCFLLRVWTFLTMPYSDFTHYCPTHLRLDALFFGVLLSHSYHFNFSKLAQFVGNNMKVLMALSVVVFMIALFRPRYTFFGYTFGFTALYLSFGLLIICLIFNRNSMLQQKILNLKISSLICKIGLYSYSIYLWHILTKVFVIHYLEHTFGVILHDTWTGFMLYFSTAIIVGIIMSKAIEMPFLKYRNKKFPTVVA